MKAWIVLLALALTGCASIPEKRYDANRSEVAKTYAALMELPECSKYEQDHPDSFLQYANCGNAIYFQAKSEWPSFAHDCRMRHMGPTACWTDFKKMLISRMRLRYKFADPHQVELRCDATPKECENISQMEWLFSDDHNDKVIGMMRMALAQENIQYLNELQQDRQIQQKAFQGLFQVQRSISCTSYNSGYLTTTNCH